MESMDYVMAFRRRWFVVVVATLLALIVGYVSKSLIKANSVTTSYQASDVLLGSSDSTVSNLSTLSWLTTVGPVPVRAAHALAYKGDPYGLAGQIQVSPDQGSGLMWIRATEPTAARARLVANTFSRELVAYLGESRSRAAVTQATDLQTQMKTLGQQIASLNARIAVTFGTQAALLGSQRDAKVTAYGVLSDQYQQVVQNSTQGAPIRIIQYAHAIPVGGGSSGASLPMRLAVAALLGLVLGGALVLILERFDRRIQTRREAERSFGLPVLGEIPVLSRRDRNTVSIERLQPFRLLGAVVASSSSSPANGDGNGSALSDRRTILVTSPAQSEGKTTIVGYLAAAFAEEGKKVMVLSCDLRRPDIHRLFQLPEDAGLVKALRANRGLGALNGHAKPTRIPNVRVVASEPSPEQAGALLSSDAMRSLLRQARAEADVVLLDSASLLKDSDPAALTDMVDGVLVVAEVGKTTTDDARSTSDLLTRLHAPVVGVALNRVRGNGGHA